MKKLAISAALLFSMATHAEIVLTNLSTRGYVGTKAQNVHAGFVITRPGKKQVLIKGPGRP